MKQVLAIHGGDSFATYEEYLQFLRDFELELGSSRKGWRSGLPEALGEGYEVILPTMPNKFNAKYLEWKIWFEKHLPYLKDGVILVGYSLGGCFLAKYLAEERVPVKVAGTMIVAAPYDEDEGRKLTEFAPPESLDLLLGQGGRIFLYHSEDDFIVSFAEQAKYATRLPGAIVRTFTDRNHFLQEEFPEIVEDIRSLTP